MAPKASGLRRTPSSRDPREKANSSAQTDVQTATLREEIPARNETLASSFESQVKTSKPLAPKASGLRRTPSSRNSREKANSSSFGIDRETTFDSTIAEVPGMPELKEALVPKIESKTKVSSSIGSANSIAGGKAPSLPVMLTEGANFEPIQDRSEKPLQNALVRIPEPDANLASLPRLANRPKRKKVSLPTPKAKSSNPSQALLNFNKRPPLIDAQLWLTEGQRLGQRIPAAGKFPCINKDQWNTVYCIKPLRWPANLKPAFKIVSNFYRGHKSIVEYVAGQSTQLHVLFRTGELRRISEFFTQRFGSPTEQGEILTALIGQPKRSNRILRWRSRDSKTKSETVLEIREIDDLRWSSPPDVNHGALRLYASNRGSIFEFLSSADLLLVQLRRR